MQTLPQKYDGKVPQCTSDAENFPLSDPRFHKIYLKSSIGSAEFAIQYQGLVDAGNKNI